MSLGTPTDGGAAYSAQGGTSVAPAYPAGIAAGDVLILIVGQKPSTANGGTVTTPTGWTLRESLTGAGGYGTTLGIDTGNTNLFVYTKNSVTGTETGNLTVTVGTNNVCWGLIVRVPTLGGTSYSFASADGSQAATPTASLSVTLNSASIAVASGDVLLTAMCIPTDVTTPSQFTNGQTTVTGLTVTNGELEEPDSATGNDIGGFVGYSTVTAGSATGNPVFTATLAGTLTNVRGPVVTLRVRDTSQTLTQTARFNNTNTFYTPTVGRGARNLTPARFDNTNTFYTAAITQSGGGQTLVQTARFNNTNTFYSATVTATRTLTQTARFNNTNTFYSATVVRGARNLAPTLYTNPNTFYSATVGRGARNLAPARYDNPNTFYSPAVTSTRTLAPARYNNTNTFYSATVTPGTATIAPARFNNTNTFYSATVIQGAGVQYLLPSLYTNTNTFYAASAQATYDLYLGPYVDDGYVDPWYIGLSLQNVSQFYSASVVPGTVTLAPARLNNTNVFYNPAVVPGATTLVPPLTVNTNTFYSATVSPGAVTLSASLYTNTNTFYPAEVVPGTVTLTPARYNNTNTFYSAEIIETRYITPSLYTNTNTFYSANVTSKVTLRPARVPSENQFFEAALAQEQFLSPLLFTNTNRFLRARLVYVLAAPLTTNTNSFFGPAATTNNRIAPTRVENTNSFFTPVVIPPNATLIPALYTNSNGFFRATVTPGAINLAPTRYNNTNAFFTASTYQFWRLQPPLLFSINTFPPPVVRRGVPVPNWNPVPMADSDSYAGATMVAIPDWENAPVPPTPAFTPDSQTATPNWNPL